MGCVRRILQNNNDMERTEKVTMAIGTQEGLFENQKRELKFLYFKGGFGECVGCKAVLDVLNSVP